VRPSRLRRKPPLPILDRGWGIPEAAPRIVRGVSGPPEQRSRESWSYWGEVWTDDQGRAIDVVPPFARTHRSAFDYELTPADPTCHGVDGPNDGRRFG
jgi:hypothetical protein